MFVETDLMSRWRVVVLVLLVGCTKPDPRSCADGTCTDPAFPFCDVGGELEGTPQTCVAVACEPGTFEACRGDQAITCNTEGTDFDLVQCELGCEDGIGCRLCNPNETACTNGSVATCDANGEVVASHACPLGCFNDEPRCREIDPSNGLAQFFDLVTDPPIIELNDATFVTDTGEVLVNGVPQDLPSFTTSAIGNGVATRIFVARSIHLSGTTRVLVSGDPRNPPSAGLAIVVLGDARIEGTLTVDPRAGGAVTGCSVGNGTNFIEQSGRPVSSGGGGGGNATEGSDGGAVAGIISPVPSATKGASSGTAEIVPFRGGCSGGHSFRTGSLANGYPSGGGALHLASGGRMTIDGTIDVRGLQQRELDTDNVYFGGGGAGGSLLLEAAQVIVGFDGKLLASGGEGAGCVGQNITAQCRPGGAGATSTSPATPGSGVTAPGTAPAAVSSGGGGGGLGRIRINTPNAAFTSASSSVVDGDVTTGELGTK